MSSSGAEGPGETVNCHAPFASLYLDQQGFARVCALYNSHALGNIATNTLRELWHGPVAQDLRRRFRAGEWGEGCHVCSWQAETGSSDQAFARIYDELPLPDGDPEWPVHLELALSNRCNLQCIMCSGAQSSSIRRHREHFPALPAAYPDRFFDELVEVLPHLRKVKFLGGEPFLIHEHHRVFDLMIAGGLETPIHVTTNGTIWNDRVARVLEHLPTSLAVSMDGIRPETVAKVRIGAELSRILTNLDRFQQYTQERGTYLGLTYCLLTENWEEFADFLEFADGRDLEVFVNTVTSPASLSLYRLPQADLADVVSQLEARDAWAQRHLRLNLAVWDDQLSRLRGQLAAKDSGEPIWMRPAHQQFPEVGVSIGRTRSTNDDSVAMPAWAEGGPVATLELDSLDRVVNAEPRGERFLHLPTDVMGMTFGEIAAMIVSFYGRPSDYELVGKSPELLDRIATYETQQFRTQIRLRTRRLVLGGDEPGVRVMIAVRQEALQATA